MFLVDIEIVVDILFIIRIFYDYLIFFVEFWVVIMGEMMGKC